MFFTIDLILGLLLIFTAWRTFHDQRLQRAVGWFVAFGLVLALVWLRLGVVVVAVAEASIGALLTGVIVYRVILRIAARVPDHAVNAGAQSAAYERPPPQLASTERPPLQRAPDERPPLKPDMERSPWVSFAISVLVFVALISVIRINIGDVSPGDTRGLAIPAYWFAAVGALVIALALYTFFRRAHILPRLFALNLMGSGVFLIMISMARYIRELDLVAEVLVLTGMLISLGATSLALHIFKRYYQTSRSMTLSITAGNNKRRS